MEGGCGACRFFFVSAELTATEPTDEGALGSSLFSESFREGSPIVELASATLGAFFFVLLRWNREDPRLEGMAEGL